MRAARSVVLGAARPRTPWFANVAQWSHAGAVPIEFVKCLGPDDLRTQLDAGLTVSAVLVDGGLPGVDRDLIADAHAVGAAVVVVTDPRVPVDWAGLGADALLREGFDHRALVDACTRVTVHSTRPLEALVGHAPDDARSNPVFALPTRAGRIVAVIGGGGAGTSTVAMAIAQGLARAPEVDDADSRTSRRLGRHHRRSATATTVVLADLCRHAELAMLHDTDATSPGLQDLLDLHRTGSGRPTDVRSLCYSVPERGYALLLGLRRAALWSTVRPATAASALAALRDAFDLVVLDVDDDLEGEESGGSLEIEERNLLSRTSVRTADAVVAVGDASLKGVHTLVRVIRSLHAIGVDPHRIQPVVNRAPDGRRARAEITSAVAHLTETHRRSEATRPPVYVPRRELDGVHRTVRRLPDAVVAPPTLALEQLLQGPSPEPTTATPQRITPGSLGLRGINGRSDAGAEGMSA